MTTVLPASQYRFDSAAPPHTADYLTTHIISMCRRISARRILDLGCGNGALCGALSDAGFNVTGCDPSEEGIEFARRTYPHCQFFLLGVYDDPTTLGDAHFDVVVSTEVVEHLFFPRALPRFAVQVLQPRGHLVLSTPYHGYIKNVVLALSGKFDSHFTALWDGGHIKFWSRTTLTKLLHEEGFLITGFVGAGRMPYLWKSMILSAQKQ